MVRSDGLRKRSKMCIKLAYPTAFYAANYAGLNKP